MKLYVLTSDFETVAVMDNTLDNALHYFDDEFHRYLENGASTFDLSVVKPFKRYGNATDGTEDDYQYLVENNYLVFTYQDRDYMFNIRRVEETEMSMRVYCQNLSLDLLNEYRAPYTADKQYKLAKYVEDCLYDSGYEIGMNEFVSNTRTLKWEGDQTVLARILSIANSFNAEVEFETVLNADRTIDKNLVHFRKRVGVDRQDIELKYGKDVSSIRRTVDIDDLITSIKPRGHEEDGKYVTVKNVVKEEKNTDGEVEYFTKKGSEHIYAPLATQKYGRKNPESYGSIDGKYEYDTKSDTELYNRALAELKKRCVPSYEYEIEGYYDVNIGDTIRAIDEAYNPILILEARVSEQIISFSDPSKNQTKYSNYKVLENKVSQSLLDRVNELAKMAKILQYGIDFEGSPVFKNGEGTLKMYAHVDRNNVEVTDEFSEYNWTKRNADGTIDETWTNAHQDFGKIVAVTSDDIDGTAVFSFTVEINGEQAGNATMVVSEVYDGEQGEPGVEGIQGPEGEQGIPGKDGKDGKTQYTHIAYANSIDGKLDFSVSDSAREYIGMYVDFTVNDSTNPKDYAWTKVKGQDGTQGTPGKPGTDGKTPYFHTAWANSADGKTGFSTTVSKDKLYLGTYTDYTSADSTDPTKYAWSKIKGDKGEKGDDGLPGKDGVGVKLTAITYALSTSGTTAPSSGWKENVPTLTKGQYLWTRTVWTYTDNSKETGYAVAYVAKDGNSGDDGLPGKDGVGIKSTTVQYVVSSSGTTKPTSGWANAIPAVPEGKFLWTKITWTYTDNTTEIGYSVAKAGEKGTDGKTTYLHTAYANSADGTVDFTREWPRENLVTTENNGHFYIDGAGVKKPWVHTNLYENYIAIKPNESVALQYFNNTGALPYDPAGRVNWYDKDKKFIKQTDKLMITTGTHDFYTVQAPANTACFNFHLPNYDIPMKLELGATATPYLPEGETLHYIGTYTDFNEQGSNDPSKYEWVKFVGENGKDGSNGKDGQSATEVVSGYLTNEAMLVPANPQGAVSSYANATGQFVVTEGNKTISTGITFAVKSTVSCTASIDAKGNYKVTAMTADLGTIFLTAKYKDVTVEKVAIITKAKQGATGNTGSPGKDGSKGDKGDPTGITVSSTAPSNPYTNQLWKNTGTSGGRIQNATYRWNGSSWELYTFVASNIIADTLSAIVTNTGSLNVTESLTSTFNNVPLDPIAPNGSKASGTLALGGGKLSITGKIDGKMPFEVEYATTGFDAMVRDSATSKIIGHVHMDAKDGFYVDNGLQSTTIMPGLMMLAKQGSPYSPVNLSFEDFITIPETVLTAKSGFEIYSTSVTNRPTARRTVGRVITLSGAFKNKSDIKSGTEEIEMGQVPDWARPTSPVNFVVQGTSMNRYLLYVDTTGRITISRYGTDSNYGTISSGSWLNIACMYTAK